MTNTHAPDDSSRPMLLNATVVVDLVRACFYDDGTSIPPEAVIAPGIMRAFLFDPAKLAAHEEVIEALLAQLPSMFRDNDGGGWSFLNACLDEQGRQWGDHAHMDALFVLGIAVGRASWLGPRELWEVMPGGMPYVAVKVGKRDDLWPVPHLKTYPPEVQHRVLALRKEGE